MVKHHSSAQNGGRTGDLHPGPGAGAIQLGTVTTGPEPVTVLDSCELLGCQIATLGCKITTHSNGSCAMTSACLSWLCSLNVKMVNDFERSEFLEL